MGFQSKRSIGATTKNFEAMRALKKGHGPFFRHLPGAAGEASLGHRTFGLL